MELFIFTYGAIVAQMCRDFENCSQVNEELYKCKDREKERIVCITYNYILLYLMLSLSFSFRGYNMGIRLIEDFLAKSGWTRCSDFRETTEIIAAVILQIIPQLLSACHGNCRRDQGRIRAGFHGWREATLPIMVSACRKSSSRKD